MTLVGMYFSGVPQLRSIVAPAYSREFGLLENTQNAILLAVVFMAVCGLRRAQALTERLGFSMLCAAAAFLFLEEINYGEHFWNFLTGQSLHAPRGQEFNLHNKISTSPTKSVANLILLLFFVILPLAVRERSPAWLRFIAPPRLLIVTVMLSVAVSRYAHYLDNTNADTAHALGSNIAEFREAFTYYIGLVYVHTLVFRRRWPGWRDELTPRPTGTAND